MLLQDQSFDDERAADSRDLAIPRAVPQQALLDLAIEAQGDSHLTLATGTF
jgi:hypothetical protein